MRAKRTDANHVELKQAFEKLGCWVWDMSGVGGGFPDLLIVKNRQPMLIEIKTPKGRTKKTQTDFAADCPLPCAIVRDVAGVETIVKAL